VEAGETCRGASSITTSAVRNALVSRIMGTRRVTLGAGNAVTGGRAQRPGRQRRVERPRAGISYPAGESLSDLPEARSQALVWRDDAHALIYRRHRADAMGSGVPWRLRLSIGPPDSRPGGPLDGRVN
jgi:hypothetical protein